MKLKNSTDLSNQFLRRMVSWVCRELEYPASLLRSVTFRNTRRGFSGTAWSSRHIVVRTGLPSQFPMNAGTHGDGFTAGILGDRLQAMVFITAHEIAHLDNARRKNKSRRGGSWGGSERLTDAMALRVLNAYRLNMTKLVGEWAPKEVQPTAPKPKPVKTRKPLVERRAAKAFAKEQEWEDRLKRVKKTLAQWKKKAAYYRKALKVREKEHASGGQGKTDSERGGTGVVEMDHVTSAAG